MRLTLRTMLAYLDDILEPDDTEDIRKKIDESDFAKSLMHRTRDCMRRLRLSAPPLAGRGGALDPNSVAEYLDNTLASERVPDFEKVCLESDMHLAEVASCHQILTLVLGEPAEVDPVGREKMYGIIHRVDAAQKAAVKAQANEAEVAAARASAEIADASSVANGAAAVEKISDSKISDSKVVEPASLVAKRAKPEVPDYLRESKSRFWPIVATILIAALLTGGILLAVGPQQAQQYLAGLFSKPAAPDDLPKDAHSPGDTGKPSETADSETKKPDAGPNEADRARLPGEPAETRPWVGEGPFGEPKLGPEPGVSPPAPGQRPEPVPGEARRPEGEPALTPPLRPADVPAEGSPREAPMPAELRPPAPGVGAPGNAAPGNSSPDNATPFDPPLPEKPRPGDAIPGTRIGGGSSAPITAGPGSNAPITAGPGSNAPITAGPAAPLTTTNPPSGLVNPAAVDGSVPVGGLGRYLSEGDVLLAWDKMTQAWTRVTAKSALIPGDPLLTLPVFRPTLSLGSGITLQPVGPALIMLEAPDENGVPGVVIEYGRLLMLSLGKPNNQLRVKFSNRQGVITFRGGDATAAMEVRGLLAPGQNPEAAPAIVAADLYATSGETAWQELGHESQALRAPTRRVLTQVQASEMVGNEFPKWITGEASSPLELRAAVAMEHDLTSDRPITLTMKELADSRKFEVRTLAIRSGAYLGQFDPFVAALNDPDQRSVWTAHIEALRAALARGPDVAAQVRGTFEKQRGAEAADLYRMLWGYSTDELKNGEAAKLIEYLNHDSLDYRVLSFWNLQTITGGVSLFYRPEYPATKRKPLLMKWRERLKEGKVIPVAAAGAK